MDPRLRTRDCFKVTVYYNTRTVATSVEGKSQFCRRNCSTKELLKVFRRDLVEIAMMSTLSDDDAEEEKKSDSAAPEALIYNGVIHDELELRQNLTECDIEIVKMRMTRLEILKQIKVFDDEREKQGIQNREEILKYQDQLEREATNEMESKLREGHLDAVRYVTSSNLSAMSPEEYSRASRMSKAKSSSSRNRFKCGECMEAFPDVEERDRHCAKMHGLYCDQCHGVFKSFAALDEHREVEEHW
jgi:hypothetical protein